MSGAAYRTLIDHADNAATMLDELGADHTAAMLRERVEAARADLADTLTTDHKLLLLMAAERYIAETERAMHASASLKTQTALEQQAAQLRLARAWLDRQETKL